MVDRLKDVQRKIEEGMDRAKEAAKSIEDSNPEDEVGWVEIQSYMDTLSSLRCLDARRVGEGFQEVD